MLYFNDDVFACEISWEFIIFQAKNKATLFFYRNQEMSAEARMFLILIHIFSISHPTPT